jgi:hypothetical protein
MADPVLILDVWSRFSMATKCRYLILLLVPTILAAQEKSDLQQILDRLDRLEQENRNLAAEVRSLRSELAASRGVAPPAEPGEAPKPPLEERVEVQEQRIEEQAQSKVEASQKLPITLTGMVLFNGYLNGAASGGQQNPVLASMSDSSNAAGASLSQSVIGLKFHGPKIWGGGQVDAAVYTDLFGGSSNSLNHLLRLRVATIDVDWKHTSFTVGQDKPIISPREPNSLAQVGVSPLTAAGNPWLWQPQARIEQRIGLGENSGLRGQFGIYQTSEPTYAARGGDQNALASPSRPGAEGRFEFWRQFGNAARLEIAPGFHSSVSHVDGVSIPSRLFSLDWLVQPFPKLQFSGMFFTGRNAGGIGALHQGFTVLGSGRVIPVHATGGWGQLSYLATQRLSFNIYGGQESDRGADLLRGDIHRNLIYAGNMIYRFGPNVLLGLEASQVRTNYFRLPSRLSNHYDLAVGYLF